MSMIRRLGLCKDDLIPVTMRMHAANNNGITILGAVILRFSGRAKSGKMIETRQITYVTSNANKLFLSREACAMLGMISHNFPTIGETSQDNACVNLKTPDQAAATHDSPKSPHTAPCGCLRRVAPPTKPTKPPFPVTEANRGRLQKWLIDY